MNYAQHFNTRETLQTEPIPGSSQVENSAGGYSWAVDDWTRLERFLVLGSEGGSYYATERALTRENAEAVVRCIHADGVRAVKTIVDVSEAGRAPKNDPALFALAMAAGMGPDATRKAALAALPKVARIPTHLFTFLSYVKGFRGYGRGLRRAVAGWYNDAPIERLAYHLAKYRQRGRWTHRDALRLAHPVPADLMRKGLYQWAVGKGAADGLPKVIEDFGRLSETDTAKEAAALIAENRDLTWEMVPSGLLGAPVVWEALLPNMPLTAMVRNLGRMTACGLIKPMSDAARTVGEKLDGEAIRKARLHPIAILAALMTYQSGHGVKGALSWDPVQSVVGALDAAFYTAFDNVEPSGRRTMIALDVSGSMGSGSVAGIAGMTPRVAAAAMAMVTARTERDVWITAFSDHLVDFHMQPQATLGEVVHATAGISFGGTDCALPMITALEGDVAVDTFIVYTDNETWAGRIHPKQALDAYRRRMGIPAKLVVVGMVSNGFTIADPDDAGMLDVVGFDTAAPSLISDFSKGGPKR